MSKLSPLLVGQRYLELDRRKLCGRSANTLQEQSPLRIIVQILEQWVANGLGQARVTRGDRLVQPAEGLVRLTAIGVDGSNVDSGILLVFFDRVPLWSTLGIDSGGRAPAMRTCQVRRIRHLES